MSNTAPVSVGESVLCLTLPPVSVGESVDDCGGGYSESIAEMCDELQNGSVALLMQTPNGRDESGSSRDCYMFNPTLHSHVNQNMFRFLGEDSRFTVIIVRLYQPEHVPLPR